MMSTAATKDTIWLIIEGIAYTPLRSTLTINNADIFRSIEAAILMSMFQIAQQII